MGNVFDNKINCLTKKKKKKSQVNLNEEIKESCSKDKKMLVIVQDYGILYTWFLCISKCNKQLGQYKAHCGHYAKPFGTAVLSFSRVEISIVLTQEFNKLHFQECFKIKISSCICTFSGNTVSWTLVHNASVSRVAHFLVLLLLVVIVMYLFWRWLWWWEEGVWTIRRFSWRSKETSPGEQSLKYHQTQICYLWSLVKVKG